MFRASFPVQSVSHTFRSLAHVSSYTLVALVEEHAVHLADGAPVEVVNFNSHGCHYRSQMLIVVVLLLFFYQQ